MCASAFYFRLGYIGLGIGHRVYAPEWIDNYYLTDTLSLKKYGLSYLNNAIMR